MHGGVAAARQVRAPALSHCGACVTRLRRAVRVGTAAEQALGHVAHASAPTAGPLLHWETRSDENVSLEREGILLGAFESQLTFF